MNIRLTTLDDAPFVVGIEGLQTILNTANGPPSGSWVWRSCWPSHQNDLCTRIEVAESPNEIAAMIEQALEDEEKERTARMAAYIALEELNRSGIITIPRD